MIETPSIPRRAAARYYARCFIYCSQDFIYIILCCIARVLDLTLEFVGAFCILQVHSRDVRVDPLDLAYSSPAWKFPDSSSLPIEFFLSFCLAFPYINTREFYLVETRSTHSLAYLIISGFLIDKSVFSVLISW